MDLVFDVVSDPDSWTISWDDRQEARFKEVTGEFLSNAVDRKLTSLGGQVFLTRQNGVRAFQIENLAYSHTYLTFPELVEAIRVDLWTILGKNTHCERKRKRPFT